MSLTASDLSPYFGPFAAGQALAIGQIAQAAAIDLGRDRQSQDILGGALVTSTPDPATGLQKLDNPAAVFSAIHAKPTIVIDGDSFCANGVFTDATNSAYTNKGYWVHVLAQLKWPVDVLATTGIAGQTAQQIFARFETSITPYMPTFVMADLGQNNLGDVDNGVAAIAAIRSYALRCRDLGIKLILLTVTPRYNTFHTAQIRTTHFNINAAIVQMARDGIVYRILDSSAAMTDPTSSIGSCLAGLTYDEGSAGVHPGPKANYRIGRQAVRDLSGIFASPFARIPSNQDSRLVNGVSKQLIQNPKMSGNAGTVNSPGAGVAPDSWTVTVSRDAGSTTVSTGTANVAETGDAGRVWFKQTFSGTVAASKVDVILLQQSQQFASMIAAVTPGTDIIKYARVNLKAASLSTNLQYIEVWVEILANSTVLYTLKGMADSTYVQSEWPDGEMVIALPGVLIPATATRTRTTIRAAFGAGACSGDLFVTDAELRIA